MECRRVSFCVETRIADKQRATIDLRFTSSMEKSVNLGHDTEVVEKAPKKSDLSGSLDIEHEESGKEDSARQAELMQNFEKMKAQVKSMEEECKAIKRKHDDGARGVEALKAEINALNSKNTEINDVAKKTDKELAETRIKEEIKTKENERLQIELNRVQESVKGLEAKAKELSRRAEEKDKEHKGLEAVIEAVNTSIG